ncbi:MAG: hypothetical protein ACR2H3_15015 [Acidimicrobiales bacterium]
MPQFVWPADDGWPYPDAELEVVDLTSSPDDDLLALQTAEPAMLGRLDPIERDVLTARFGLGGAPVRTMKQLHRDLGVTPADLRLAMGSGLAKLRAELTA